MVDLLLPETDAGVAAQVVGLAIAYGLTLWFARRLRHWQLLATGVAVLILAFMGVRALH